MGWAYRKSLNVGPFRMNLSKSGIGYSLGGTGFRTGVSAKGRKYSRLTIPGTGIYYTTSKSNPGGLGCLVMLLACFSATAFAALFSVWRN